MYTTLARGIYRVMFEITLKMFNPAVFFASPKSGASGHCYSCMIQFNFSLFMCFWVKYCVHFHWTNTHFCLGPAEARFMVRDFLAPLVFFSYICVSLCFGCCLFDTISIFNFIFILHFGCYVLAVLGSHYNIWQYPVYKDLIINEYFHKLRTLRSLFCIFVLIN